MLHLKRVASHEKHHKNLYSKCMNVSCCAQKIWFINKHTAAIHFSCMLLATYFSPPTFYFSFDGLRMFFLVFTIDVLHLSALSKVPPKNLKVWHSVWEHKLSIKLQEDEDSASHYRTHVYNLLLLLFLS